MIYQHHLKRFLNGSFNDVIREMCVEVMDNMKQNFKMAIHSIGVVYCITVLLYQIFYLLIPFRQMIDVIGGTWISSGLAVLGILVLGIDLLTERLYSKIPYSKWLIVVLAILCISSLVYIKYGWAENAKVIIWQAVQMLVVYSCCYRLSKKTMYRVLNSVYMLVSIVFVVAVLVSLYQFFCQISYDVIDQGGIIRQGFQEGRLFGVFGSVYFSSLFMVLMLAVAVYQIIHTTRLRIRVWNIFVAIPFAFYIILSGTRSVLVASTMAVFLLVTYLTWKRIQKRTVSRYSNKQYIACLLVGILSSGILLAVYSGVDFLLKEAIIVFSQPQETEGHSGIQEGNGHVEVSALPTPEVDESEIPVPEDNGKSSIAALEREDMKLSNISNGRFQIWHDYCDVLTRSLSTVLLGITPGNYMTIIKENYPDIFIVSYIRDTYPQMYANGLIYDTHNGYLSVLVTTGVFGGLALGGFLISCFRRVWCYFIKNNMYSSKVLLLFILIFIILVSVFFDSDLFFKCTSTSVVFWLLSGVLMREITIEK